MCFRASPYNWASSINHPDGFSPALVMLSELSHSKTTSFSPIYCFFPFYTPPIEKSSFRKSEQHWKPDDTWKSYDHWKSTARISNNVGGAYLLGYLSHRAAVMDRQMICYHLRTFTQEWQQRFSKPPVLLVLSLYVFSSTFFFFNYRQLDISITVGPFSDMLTLVHSEWH